MNSRLWKIILLSIPVTGILRADEFDVLKARYAADQNMYRRDMIVAEANAPRTTPEQRTVTNAVPADVLQKVQQLNLMLTNFTAIIQQVGMNFEAVKEYALNHAAELTPDQQTKLFTCERLWLAVKDHAPDGLANFQPVTTNTVTVSVPAPSIAQERLGRQATAEDLK